jgi:hypothetical protein
MILSNYRSVLLTHNTIKPTDHQLAKKSKTATGKAANAQTKSMVAAAKSGKGTLSFTPKKPKKK